jgi:hypothetical protein
MKTTELPAMSEALSDILCQDLIPVVAAPLPASLRAEIKSAPELPALCQFAIRENELIVAQGALSSFAAKADAAAETAALRENPTPANVEKLKSLPPLAARIAAYDEQARFLSADQKRIRIEARELRASLALRVAARFVELRDAAAADEAAVFQKHGLPVPESQAAPHYYRAAQEILRDLQREFESGVGFTLQRFLQGLGVEVEQSM